MSAKKYLVTGATGSTGRSTVKYLREQGAEVLALVHRDDKRAEQLRSIGAETVVGDLLHFESVRNALEGINAAYFGLSGPCRNHPGDDLFRSSCQRGWPLTRSQYVPDLCAPGGEEPCCSRPLDRRAGLRLVGRSHHSPATNSVC
jgi:hypothetical protein